LAVLIENLLWFSSSPTPVIYPDTNFK
jgi:hypothetical protein